MGEKHESISRPQLWYCFVAISIDTKNMRYFIVPSAVVSKYVGEQHQLWLNESKGKDSVMRLFRMGMKNEKYKIATPTIEEYEDNWEFK